MNNYSKEKCNGCLISKTHRCFDCPEVIEEAKELIKAKGICKNTLCDECVYKRFKGSAWGCTPDNAVNIAKMYLKKYEGIKK